MQRTSRLLFVFLAFVSVSLFFSAAQAARSCEDMASLNPQLQAAAQELQDSIQFLELMYLHQSSIPRSAAESTKDITNELSLVKRLKGATVSSLQGPIRRAEMLIRVLEIQNPATLSSYRQQWMGQAPAPAAEPKKKGRPPGTRPTRARQGTDAPAAAVPTPTAVENSLAEPIVEALPSDPRLALEQTLMQARRRLSGKFTPDARLALNIRKLVRQAFDLRSEDSLNALTPDDKKLVLSAFEVARTFESDGKGSHYTTDTRLTRVFELELGPRHLMPGILKARAQFQFHDMRSNRGNAIHRLLAITMFYKRDPAAEWNRYVDHNISRVVWLSRSDRNQIVDKKERQRLQRFQWELLSLYSNELAPNSLLPDEDSTVTLVVPLMRLRADSLRGIWAFGLPPDVTVDQRLIESLGTPGIEQTLVGERLQTLFGRMLVDATDLIGDTPAMGGGWQIIHVGGNEGED